MQASTRGQGAGAKLLSPYFLWALSVCAHSSKRVVMRARVFVRDVEAPRDSMATVRAGGGSVWKLLRMAALGLVAPGLKILRIRGSLAFRPSRGATRIRFANP